MGLSFTPCILSTGVQAYNHCCRERPQVMCTSSPASVWATVENQKCASNVQSLLENIILKPVVRLAVCLMKALDTSLIVFFLLSSVAGWGTT